MMDGRGATGTQGEWLTGLVIVVGILAMVAAAAGAVYWIGSEADGAVVAASSVTAKPVDVPASPRTPTPRLADEAVFHADVYFDFKSTRLRADGVRVLQEHAALMESTSAWVVLVQGYADRHGPVEYNRALAQRRADVVKQFLVDLGVPETSIRVVTIGQEGALCEDPGKECQQLNRRVHLEIRQLPFAATPARGAIAQGDELLTDVDSQVR